MMVLLSSVFDVVFSWLPLYFIGKTCIYLAVLLEGKLTITVARRLDSYLDFFDQDLATLFHTETALRYVAGPYLSLLSHCKDVLKQSCASRTEVRSICETYIQDIDILNPSGQPQEAKPTVAVVPAPSPSPVQRVPSKPKPKVGKKAFSWTVTVQLLMKKATKGEPALYFPHKVWFEPQTKRLYWEASGDDRCQSGEVGSVKVQSKSSLTLQVVMAGGDVKVLRFSDAETFQTWSVEVLKVVEVA